MDKEVFAIEMRLSLPGEAIVEHLPISKSIFKLFLV